MLLNLSQVFCFRHLFAQLLFYAFLSAGQNFHFSNRLKIFNCLRFAVPPTQLSTTRERAKREGEGRKEGQKVGTKAGREKGRERGRRESEGRVGEERDGKGKGKEGKAMEGKRQIDQLTERPTERPSDQPGNRVQKDTPRSRDRSH